MKSKYIWNSVIKYHDFTLWLTDTTEVSPDVTSVSPHTLLTVTANICKRLFTLQEFLANYHYAVSSKL
jgi:hypothetical protein